MNTEIFFAGRVVGEVRADGYFQKHLQFSRHLLQKPRASIALNVDVLESAERDGAHSVEIIDSETNKRYRASIAKIRARGFFISRGQGEQIALPLAQWDSDQPRADITPSATTRVEQPRLFSF